MILDLENWLCQIMTLFDSLSFIVTIIMEVNSHRDNLTISIFGNIGNKAGRDFH